MTNVTAAILKGRTIVCFYIRIMGKTGCLCFPIQHGRCHVVMQSPPISVVSVHCFVKNVFIKNQLLY